MDINSCKNNCTTVLQYLYPNTLPKTCLYAVISLLLRVKAT